jgi:sn-glycerol 3-phosphate transport system substrate-binding protein
MKRLSVVLMFLLSAMILSALGSSEKSDRTTVTIWHSSQGTALNAFEEIVEEFNEGTGKEKGIEIEAVYQGKANDVLTKVNAALGTDSLPDIAMMDATAALDMDHTGAVVTLEELGLDTSSILPAALASYTSEKGTIALPFNGSALLYFYNKTLFDEKGVTVPTTIDEMTAVAPLLAEKDDSGSPTLSFFSGVPTTYELSYFISQQNGGTYLVNNKNGHEGGATKVLFGEEGTYKAFLEKWTELFRTGCCSALTSGVSDDFLAGRTASMLASSSNLTKILSSVGDSFEVGVARVPLVNETSNGKAIVSGGALFSFTNSEAVKTVLEYLSSSSVQAYWSEMTGYVPVNTEAYTSEEYTEFLEENPLYRVALEYLEDSDGNAVNVWLPSAYTIYYSFQKNVSDAVNGKDIDEAVSEMVKTVQDALDVYNAQN